MALTREENNIPYGVIAEYAARNEDLREKLQAASKLQTAEAVLAYVRNLKYKDGNIDQEAQFLILATHRETIKKYPYLNNYLDSGGDDIFRHNNWNGVRAGMEHDRLFHWLFVGPFLTFLGAVSHFFVSKAVFVSRDNAMGGNESFESSCGMMRNAILGSLAFFGARGCTRLIPQDHNELEALDNLRKSLGFKG